MLLKIMNMIGIKEVLLKWFTNFFIKSLLLAKEQELDADIADIKLISKHSFLCVTNAFSKYAWVFPLKGKKMDQ